METKTKSTAKTVKSNEVKTYSILSYIGILWIIGLFVPQKDDKSLKFHIGQGMILTILEVGLGIISSILNSVLIANIFRQEIITWGMNTGVYTVGTFGLVLMGLISWTVTIIAIVYAVIGISNVLNNKQKELPIIGKFAFYK